MTISGPSLTFMESTGFPVFWQGPQEYLTRATEIQVGEIRMEIQKKDRKVIKVCLCTPLKINMEPKSHPIENENRLPNLHFGVPC